MTRYSIDFRQKIVDVYEQGKGSIRELAKRFLVSPDTVQRLVNTVSGDRKPDSQKVRKPQKECPI